MPTPFMKEVYLDHQQLDKIPQLEDDTEKLIIFRNKITSIDCLPSSIKELDLSDNQIRKIENLGNLKNLQILDLSFNMLDKIENLECNKEITDLFLFSNDISQIENLSCLQKLKHLDLSNNRIQEIKHLDELIRLEQLYVANNQINDIPDLKFLVNLKVLGLQNNAITELDCDNLPKSLHTLLLGENVNLTSLKNHEKLENLRVMELYKTKLKDIRVSDKVELS